MIQVSIARIFKVRISNAIRWSVVFTTFCFMVGCGSLFGPDKPQAVGYSLFIKAGADINPSRLSRANPVVLYLYQLNALEPFKSAQVIDLYRRDATLLANTLVHKTSLKSLLPNEQRTLEISIQPGAKYLAVFAEFSNYGQAKTRAWVDVSKLDKISSFNVSVNLLTVRIVSNKDDDSWWHFW